MDSGFLTKEKVGRRYQLHLTDKGQEAFAVSHQVFFDWDDQRLDGLSGEERQNLFDLLQKVARNSRPLPREAAEAMASGGFPKRQP